MGRILPDSYLIERIARIPGDRRDAPGRNDFGCNSVIQSQKWNVRRQAPGEDGSATRAASHRPHAALHKDGGIIIGHELAIDTKKSIMRILEKSKNCAPISIGLECN
jgi:hypothetical protein